MHGNRVYCLYRVSTNKQVDYNDQNIADIPMQRKACHEFADKMGWSIIREEQETGISGFKVSAANRDKIQLIKEHAEKGKFDILLVFMFDRLGRKADETPFIVEWLTKKGMLEDLRSDKDLCAAYIHLVNGSKKVSDHTIKCLVDLNVFYPMSGLVIDRFFETQNYRHYIIAKTLSDGCFTMETGERGEILWPEYISIFSGTKYPKTREYMGHNQDFLSRIQANRDYKDFSEEARVQLVSINQDKESLEDVLEYGDDFALKYYCQIQGFKDWEAASAFVEIVIHNELLRSSQELYKHTHEKLLDGRLKFRYTMNRKRS